jgi:hypothetical protein
MFSHAEMTTKLENLLGITSDGGSGRIDYIEVKDSFLYEDDNILSGIPIVMILFVVWISGLTRYLFIILRSIIAVTRLKLGGEINRSDQYNIVRANMDKGCFTFFRSIFTGKEFESLSESEKEQILTHEKIHAEQLHTLDNLIFELYRAVFWFNPLSRLLSANVKIIHEFIVDTKLTGNVNRPDYSRLILKLASHRSHALMASSFSNNEIKNRIKLISRPESHLIRKRRFIISIPVLIFTVFAVWLITSTVNMYAYEKEQIERPFVKPFDKGNYRLIGPFFENKSPAEIYKGKDNDIEMNAKLRISHRENAYEVKSFSNVYAIESGTVSHIKKDDIFGLEEYSVIILLETGHEVSYKGLHKLTTRENDTVEKGEIIGITGDLRLYPDVKIKLSKNGKALDAEMFY